MLYRRLYKRKRSEVKGHLEVLRALPLRWVKILWRMWTDQVPYDESYHKRRKSTDVA